MSEGKDPYAVLGVSRDASADDVRSSYRRLARQYHPDLNPGNEDAEERFKEVATAYDVLSDPEQRRLYDEFGEASQQGGFEADKAREYRRWAERREEAGRPFHEEVVDFDLGDLLGGAFGQARRPRRMRGEDLQAVVDIDLAQAIEGMEIELRKPTAEPCKACDGSGDEPGTTPAQCTECEGAGKRQVVNGPLRMVAACPACGGTGKRRPPCRACTGAGSIVTIRPLKVRIPPGADDRTRFVVKGRGAPGAGGGKPGDLLVETRVRPHPHFRREALDLHLTLPVTLDEAYSGAEIDVPTPGGSVKLKVPRRSQQGAKLRLRGKGVHRKGKRGDLFVALDVRMPDGDSAELETALEAASAAYGQPVRGRIYL